MKKFIYLSGISFTNIFLIGAIMKMSHWPGADMMILAGLGAIALLFLPMATFKAYRDEENKALLWVYLSGFICAFIDIIGALFKILHFPGANKLLMVGIPLPFVVFLPVFIYHHIKRKEPQMKGFLGVMFLLTYIAIFTALLAFRA